MVPPPPKPPGSRAARRDRLKAPERKKGPLLAAAGGVVVLLVLLYYLILGGGKPHHTIDVTELESEPTGDPISVAYDVHAGDAFETVVVAHGAMGISVTQAIPAGGMALDSQLTTRHEIVAKEGGRLSSTVSARCDTFTTTVPMDERFIPEHEEFVLRFDRDSSGRPVATSVVYEGLEGYRKLLLALVSAGLCDWATNYLPPRPVRVGEAWNLAETADVSSATEIVRFVATLNKPWKGFPTPTTKGRVKVAARESHADEDSLRLRISLSTNVEGPVTKPAREGSISAAMKVEGDAWISMKTGLLLETNLDASLISTYLWDTPKTSNERKVAEHVHTVTKRAAPR